MVLRFVLLFLVVSSTLFHFLGCKSSSTVVNTSELSKDSTRLVLKIQFQRGCTENEQSIISCSLHPKLNFCRISSYDITSNNENQFRVRKDSFWNALNLFEKEANKRESCGGYGGGTGVYVQKHYNLQISHFSYCQEYGDNRAWNGLEYFFGLMGRKLEDYPFKQ